MSTGQSPMHDGCENGERTEWLGTRLSEFQAWRFGLLIDWRAGRPSGLDRGGQLRGDLNDLRDAQKAWLRAFNPQGFDPTGWARDASRAGMRYSLFNVRGSDGFCLWNTRTSRYRITHPDCPFSSDSRSDAWRAFLDAFRGEGMAVGCSLAKADQHSPFYWAPEFPVDDGSPNYDPHRHPGRRQRYMLYLQAQIQELMSDPGAIDLFLLRDSHGPASVRGADAASLEGMLRRLQSRLLFTCPGAGDPFEDYDVLEGDLPAEVPEKPWERHLALQEEGGGCRPSRDVVHELVRTVARGGNLLLKVEPTSEGCLADEARRRMREVGEWLDVNGPAIYGAGVPPAQPDDCIWYTQRGSNRFAILCPPRGEGRPPSPVRLSGARLRENRTIRLLGSEQILSWHGEGDSVIVEVPTSGLPCDFAWTLAFSPCE